MSKRYLSKQRPMTEAERLEWHRIRIEEAQDELEEARKHFDSVVATQPPLTTTEYVEVKPGEPGYEDAPFENTLIMSGREMALQVAAQPSPWTGMLAKGVYPANLGKL